MLNIADYIFYRSYKRETEKIVKTPMASAVINVSFIIMLYISIITLIIGIFFKINPFVRAYEQGTKIKIATIAITVAVSVYFFYIYKKRYLKVIKKYNNIEKTIIKKYNIKTNLFVIFSIFLNIILLIIFSHINY